MVNIDALIASLKAGEVNVTFTKVDGTVRNMRCTLKEDILPAQIDLEETIQKRKVNDAVLAVWDLDNAGWRSFRKESVTAYEA